MSDPKVSASLCAFYRLGRCTNPYPCKAGWSQMTKEGYKSCKVNGDSRRPA